MYSAFRLKLAMEGLIPYCEKEGKEIYNNIKNQLFGDLDEIQFRGDESFIDGKQIQNLYFPIHDTYDIFLSHSHADETLAICLAGFFKKKLGLNVFIDSCLWGYSDSLLKKLDNAFCKQEHREFNDYDICRYDYYNYSKRNKSTSHVHMMLSIALTNMIDKCEMFLLLDTENAIQKYAVSKQSPKTTYSPWIFHELSALNTLRINKPARLENKSMILESVAKTENFGAPIIYPVEDIIKKMKSLLYADLQSCWFDGFKKGDALDFLYKRKNLIY